MSQNSLGIYADSPLDDDTITKIKTHFADSRDVVVFSDKPLLLQDLTHAFMPSFYMYFFNHPLVFLSSKGLDNFKSKVVSEKLYLYENDNVVPYAV